MLSPVWPLPFALIHGPNIPGSYAILLYSIGLYFHHQSHPQLGDGFALAPSLHSLWSSFSTDLQYDIGYLPSWGILSAFSYCSWGSQGKNTKAISVLKKPESHWRMWAGQMTCTCVWISAWEKPEGCYSWASGVMIPQLLWSWWYKNFYFLKLCLWNKNYFKLFFTKPPTPQF